MSSRYERLRLQHAVPIKILAVTLALQLLIANCSGVIEPDSDSDQPVRTDVALSVQTQPGDAASGVSLGTQPVVQLLDDSGNVVTGDNSTVITAALASGAGSLEGSTSVTLAAGVARFADLAVAGTVGDYTLSFSAPGLASVTSDAFTLRPGPASTQMSVVTASRTAVGVGETAILTLRARDAQGNAHTTGGLTVTFNAAGGSSQGTIGATQDNDDGTYQAVFTGMAAGTPTTISATIDGEPISSQLPTIQVTTAPSGRIVFFEEHFEDADLASRGWYDIGATPRIVFDAERGSNVIEMTFNQGESAVDSKPGRHLFDESETVYLAFWVRYSENWVGSGGGAHPHEFFFLTTVDPNPFQGPSAAVLQILVEQTHCFGGFNNCGVWGPDPNITGMFPWIGANGRRMRAPEVYFADDPAAFGGTRYKADWHRIEVFMQMNSDVGVPDGIARYWYDGELIIDLSDVLFRAEPAQAGALFNHHIAAPWMASSPITQTMWIDDLVVATER